MKQNKKYYGNAVQAILDTAIEKYCSNGCEIEEEIREIINLLNVAEDMTIFYDLMENESVHYRAVMINSMLIDDNRKYRILREKDGFKLATLS